MTVLFRDDFTAPSLDTKLWSTGWFGTGITHPVNGAERAAYDPACVTIKNGKLHLHLKHQPVQMSAAGMVRVKLGHGGPGMHTMVAAAAATSYPERTGCVTTHGKFQTPNTNYAVEARIHLIGTETALYNWPAFWLDGLGTWPHTGENDVMEGLGGHASWHYHSDAGGPGGSASLGEGWHTFRCEVKGATGTYFYDGKQVGSLAVVQSPQYIILGNQSGQYGGENVEGDMKVDYVEVATL